MILVSFIFAHKIPMWSYAWLQVSCEKYVQSLTTSSQNVYKKGRKKCRELWCVLEFNVQNLFSWQWLCLDFIDKDWCLRKVELKIARTHIEQITAKAAAHSGGNVMMTWWQQNFKQITMCLKPLSSSIWPSSCHRWEVVWTRLLPKFIILYQ